MNHLAESGSGIFLIWMGSVKLKSMMGMALLAAAASVLAWSGWALYRERYPSWYEEVRLSDGRIITIKQRRRYFPHHGTTDSWVSIDLLELHGKYVWHSRLIPQGIDVYDGKVYAFGIPDNLQSLSFYRYPKYYIVAFIWDGRDFVRIPFLSMPHSIRKEENLYRCIPTVVGLPLWSKVDIKQKYDIWCPARGRDNSLGRNIDVPSYKAAVDRLAKLARWKDENRSD